VNAGEGPATDIEGEVFYDQPGGGLQPLTISIHASVILPGRERRFVSVVGPGDLSFPAHEHFAASQRIRVTGSFSDPRRLESGLIRPNEPKNTKTLARSIDQVDAASEQSRLDENLAVPLMVPDRASGDHSSADVDGQRRVVNLRAVFNVQNKGPTEVALGITGGLELDGVEYADSAPPHAALAVGASIAVQVVVPDAALANLPEPVALAALTSWVRFSDRRERRWRTTLGPDGKLDTTRER
jgi:hypothetical protein